MTFANTSHFSLHLHAEDIAIAVFQMIRLVNLLSPFCHLNTTLKYHFCFFFVLTGIFTFVLNIYFN